MNLTNILIYFELQGIDAADKHIDRYHQTQALMGATRLASEKEAATYFAEFVFTFLYSRYSRRETRLLKNAPMLGKENCYKYFRISLKLISFTSNNTL